MKITTYYPNGSVKDVHEHTIDVPKYICSYDPKHSFLNIGEEDVDAVTYKKKDLEKGVLAKSNGELVDKVVRMAKLLGREVATSDEARVILGLKK